MHTHANICTQIQTDVHTLKHTKRQTYTRATIHTKTVTLTYTHTEIGKWGERKEMSRGRRGEGEEGYGKRVRKMENGEGKGR